MPCHIGPPNSARVNNPPMVVNAVKKIGRIPDGGGWRAWGRDRVRRRGRVGYDYIHSAVDDHTRLAYCEIHTDEQGPTAAGFVPIRFHFVSRPFFFKVPFLGWGMRAAGHIEASHVD